MASSSPDRGPFQPPIDRLNDGKTEENLPQKGKVEQVRKEWLVHEDGAMAYKLQTEENNFHYGMNRFQRKTVRGDIPVAKLVQSEEEKRLQEERLRQLEELRTQAEKDAVIAKQVAEQEKHKVHEKNTKELDDEAIARQMQEKEKKKYERYLEKKKEKELKKKRERLEKELAEQSEQARVSLGQDGSDSQVSGIERLNGSTDRLSLDDSASAMSSNGHTRYMYRVRPSGQIEDDGDFSDFYALPPGDDTDPLRRHIQESQDEELARLLQEQEHKRTKAEVDRNKLKAMELQDEELAKVIQEQEELKARKARQKRQQLKEQKLLLQQQQQQQQQEQQRRGSESNRDPAHRPLPDPTEQPPYQHRYRRDSYTRSISNNSGPVQDSPVAHHHSRQMSDDEQWYNMPDDDITSARELSQRVATNTRTDMSHSSRQMVAKPPRHNTRPSQQLPASEVPSVERWLAESVPSSRQPAGPGHNSVMLPSPSPPGSYHSEEESQNSLEYSPRTRTTQNTRTGPQPFNIAAAIDPTYKRRQHEIDDGPNDQTQLKALGFSRSLPVDDSEVEWDPAGLRGSLRRPKGQFNPTNTHSHFQDGSATNSNYTELESPTDSNTGTWQPVQGQRRSTLDNRRKMNKSQGSVSNGGKNQKGGSCKQQ